MTRRRVLALVPLLAVAFCACASSPAAAPARAPGNAIEALESRLLAAHTLRIRARLASGGRIESHFEGTLVAGLGQRVRLVMDGDFGSRVASARLVCDGRRMHGGSRDQSFDFDAPRTLRDGIVMGLVRRGLLHDVARLAAGLTPEPVDAIAHTRLDRVTHAPGEAVRGAATERWTWTLFVGDKRAADEELWLDAGTGLPVRRRVVVHFPEGDMQAGEEYEEFVVDAPVDEAAFVVDAGAAP